MAGYHPHVSGCRTLFGFLQPVHYYAKTFRSLFQNAFWGKPNWVTNLVRSALLVSTNGRPQLPKRSVFWRCNNALFLAQNYTNSWHCALSTRFNKLSPQTPASSVILARPDNPLRLPVFSKSLPAMRLFIHDAEMSHARHQYNTQMG